MAFSTHAGTLRVIVVQASRHDVLLFVTKLVELTRWCARSRSGARLSKQ